MSESIALDLRNDFFKNVMAKDIGFFDANRSGDLVSRLNNDVAVV